MDHEHGSDGYSYPHWKAVGSYTEDPSCPGSFRIPARALNIIWGNDSRYWKWITLKDEDKTKIGFEEGAVLIQVNWIEVTGKLEISPSKFSAQRYRIYYLIKFRADAFGWHSIPIKFKVTHNGQVMSEICVLLEPYRAKYDVWHEILAGEFSVDNGTNALSTVEFGMYETESDWWKGSMVLGGVKVLPKV